ncbi:MAG: SDR family oxidoreductase [Phycisphaerae bacterium]|nr:SDR family oxidoreductase [Phycisphaerae bacterium]
MKQDDSKVILITGCSSGIGRAAAEHLAGRGHIVYATARRPESVDELETWARIAGDQARVARLDVQDSETIQVVVDRIRSEAGRLDVVINNAGYGQFGPVEEVTDEQVWRQFDVNLVGVMRVSRAVVPLMRACRTGRIVNISSLSAHVTMPFMGMYCASKHALDAVSAAMRMELARWNIRVIVVEPGPVPTPFQEKVRNSGADATNAQVSPYAEVRARVEESRRKLNSLGAAPMSRVVRAIEHAATARRPRIRYYDAALARWVPRLFSLLPDRLIEWAIRREVGL